MQLVEFVPPVRHPLWTLCLQMGIDSVVIKVNPAVTGLPDPWRFPTLSKIVAGLKAAGLRVVGLEGDPFDMTPVKAYGASDDPGGRYGEAGGTARPARPSGPVCGPERHVRKKQSIYIFAVKKH